MQDSISIGQRVKARREELNMTQEELAKKSGYSSRSTINLIEHDKRRMKQDKILSVATALKVTPAYLMGWLPDDDSCDFYTPTTQFNELSPYEMKIMERIQFLSAGNQVAVLNIINQLIDAQKEFEK